MEPNFFKYVWRHSRAQQLLIIAVIFASFPIYFISLNLPKDIVNGPIQGGWFENDETVVLARITTEIFGAAPENAVVLFDGIDATRAESLIFLSLAFLAAVVANGFFRFFINKRKGQLGERMLRRLRYELVDRLLRFPVGEFRNLRSSEVSSMVKDEVEPLGGFIGDAFAQPLFLVGQAVTVLAFIITQNIWLGCIALGIVALQTSLIPRLRRILLVLARERQLAARQLAGDVGEIVDSMTEIRVNDASNFERAVMTKQLGDLFFIRNNIYLYKFLIKYLNNIISQTAPFLFYLVGGLLALRGDLDVGQLVAVIAAYKDLPGPIKELIDWDQQRVNAQLRYGQVVEQFAPSGMTAPEEQEPTIIAPEAFTPPLSGSNISIVDDAGAPLIDQASFSIAPGEQVGVVDREIAGASALARAMVRLTPMASGELRLSNRALSEIPESALGRRIAYIGETPYFRDGTLRDGLLYAVRHARPDSGATDASSVEMEEAQRAGNATLPLDGDWFDAAALAVSDQSELDQALLDVLDRVELIDDVFDLGLAQPVGPLKHDSDLGARLLTCRERMQSVVAGKPALAEIVEPFAADRYLRHMSLGQNLLFGAPVSAESFYKSLSKHDAFRVLLERQNLHQPLLRLGREMASTIVELFSDLPENHPFYERLPFIKPNQIPELRRYVNQTRHRREARWARAATARFLELALQYVEPGHRFGLLTDELQSAIVKARSVFRQFVESAPPGDVDVWREDALIASMSLEENILFGRINPNVAAAPALVRAQIRRVADEVGVLGLMVEHGLSYRIGTGGRRLSQQQRQKASLARAVLKRPALLVVDNGLSALDATTFERLLRRFASIGRDGWRGYPYASLWTMRDATHAEAFDRLLVLENGQLSPAAATT